MIGETVTRLRGGRTQFGGDPTTDAELDIPGCLFAPTGGYEQTNRADTVITQPTLYVPLGVDVRSTDRFRIRGSVYQVDGQPADWRAPWNGFGGLAVPLRGVSG